MPTQEIRPGNNVLGPIHFKVELETVTLMSTHSEKSDSDFESFLAGHVMIRVTDRQVVRFFDRVEYDRTLEILVQ